MTLATPAGYAVCYDDPHHPDGVETAGTYPTLERANRAAEGLSRTGEGEVTVHDLSGWTEGEKWETPVLELWVRGVRIDRNSQD